CLASRRRSAAKLAVVLLTAVSAPLAGNAGAETEPGSFVAVDLGTLGGTYSHAEAVNASGGVVGYSFTRGKRGVHAFSWTPAGGLIDLGTLGGTSSVAVAVNASGEVVGHSTTSGEAAHAFLWTQAGGLIDLGTLGGTYSIAVAVSASGQVVGHSA